MSNTAVSNYGPAGASLPGRVPGKAVLWTGRILSAIPVAMLLFSASMKLSGAPAMAQMWTDKFGFPDHTRVPVGFLEIAVALVYAVPRTAVLGAILVACYLAGATVAHVRIDDPGFITPVILGVFAWAGLYLRDARVRALLPLRARA